MPIVTEEPEVRVYRRRVGEWIRSALSAPDARREDIAQALQLTSGADERQLIEHYGFDREQARGWMKALQRYRYSRGDAIIDPSDPAMLTGPGMSRDLRDDEYKHRHDMLYDDGRDDRYIRHAPYETRIRTAPAPAPGIDPWMRSPKEVWPGDIRPPVQASVPLIELLRRGRGRA